METHKQNKILIWAVIILFIANITTVASVWISKKKYAAIANEKLIHFKNKKNRHQKDFIINQLNLNPEQTAKIKKEKSIYKSEARIIKGKIHDKKKKIHIEIFKSEPDCNYINQLADSIGILNAGFEKLTYQHFISIKKLMDPDQEQKFQNLLNEASAQHRKMHRHRRGQQ